MSTKKRKVSFYLLSMYKFDENKVKKTIEPKDAELCFNYIFNNMRELSTGSRAAVIDTPYIDFTIEVVDYENHIAFIKIGQQNHSDTVAIRDTDTLETHNVPMTANQLLEVFTFCVIDFNAMIISYIGINGAPRVSAIKCLFDKYILDDRLIHTEIAAIVGRDIVNLLSRKKIISKMSITIASPSDEALSFIGISSNEFDYLRNVNSQTMTVEIKAARNKSISSFPDGFGKLIEIIKRKYGDSIKGLTVNAKDSDESSQTYDLLQYCFTKTVALEMDDKSIIYGLEFKKYILDTYNSIKSELLDNINH